MAVPREKDIVTTQQKNDLRGKEEDDDEGREREREREDPPSEEDCHHEHFMTPFECTLPVTD